MTEIDQSQHHRHHFSIALYSTTYNRVETLSGASEELHPWRAEKLASQTLCVTARSQLQAKMKIHVKERIESVTKTAIDGN